MMQYILARDPEQFALFGAQYIGYSVDRFTAESGRCSIALSGGSTPRPIYERLARSPFLEMVPWEKIDVYFGDERCVLPEDPESTYGMARAALLDRVPLDTSRIHRIEAERPDRDRAAAEYAERLPDPIDILILGMGEDGHTASLFPRSPALGEKTRRVVAAESPKPPAWRITITPRVIGSAREILVMVSGERKAEMVARALEGSHDPFEIPIQLAREAMWLLDEEAASALDLPSDEEIEKGFY